MVEQLKKNRNLLYSFRVVWIIITIITLIVIVAVFICPEERILQLSPTCEYKKMGKECAFCGMTRAFIEIGHFKFQKALALNQGSLILFILLIANFLFLITYIFSLRYKLKK